MDTATLSLIVAIAALSLSVVSPIITALVNGHYRIKEKKLEMKEKISILNNEYYEKHRSEVIENFLKGAGKAIQKPNNENMSEFGATSAEVYYYIDKQHWKTLDLLNSGISNGIQSYAIDTLIDFAKEITESKSLRQKIQVDTSERDT